VLPDIVLLLEQMGSAFPPASQLPMLQGSTSVISAVKSVLLGYAAAYFSFKKWHTTSGKTQKIDNE
jgi:hypothetical protein